MRGMDFPFFLGGFRQLFLGQLVLRGVFVGWSCNEGGGSASGREELGDGD